VAGEEARFGVEDAAGARGLAELVGEDDLAAALEVAEDRLARAEAGEGVLDDLVEGRDGGLVATAKLVIWKADSARTCWVRTPAIWIFISSATGSMPPGKTCSTVGLTVPSGATVASAKPARPPGAGIWAKTSSPGVKPEPRGVGYPGETRSSRRD
jgi:hypothetical protein